MRSYDLKIEDGRVLRRNQKHLCRSREPLYSSQPREAAVALQPRIWQPLQRNSKGLSQQRVGQSFPTVPAQGDQSKQLTKTPVALPSKAQPLCTTLNKSQLVENRITRAAARFSKVLVTFGPEIKYSNQNIKNKGTGPAQQTTSFCFTN